ncbi:endonuclease MutS2 [Alkalicoccus urumqiensis]|uniref:Endonuclease MutS2 n=1 Tax=Alkalicoccus urumqiensis TaxID=1548213 RepID=A0A2P6MF99_ALKUR|nr:endonuclease MutS2 [Alkalicoccus urumqiensis]PRO64954.1 endonuclease MutS2 [Alkalicoccus urumqiensis]
MSDRMMRVLEYTKMKEQLEPFAGSSLGKQRVQQLKPMYTLEEVTEAQRYTAEAAKVLRLKGNIPLGGLRDIRAQVKRAEIGGDLNAGELLDTASTIYASRRFSSFVEQMVEDDIDLSLLPEMVEEMVPLTDLQREIQQAVDEDGRILDSASPALRTIRQQIRTLESQVRAKLESITRSGSGKTMLSDAIVTIRNDRYVIPVKAEYRGHFGGIVHDQSASGQTLFIEPESVVQLNNQLREARSKEKHEIDRILRELSASVGLHTAELLVIVRVMTEVDFMFAKAYFAASMNAVEPSLNDEGRLEMKGARHPLIPDEEIVPIDVELGGAFRTLVITGPNTGGKTVTLKTVGLLTLMVQSGLFFPCEEGSSAAVFHHIFADIGDEQSIEQSLSTFSSHMTNIVDIMEHLDHRSLVLFDELGAGTDPTEGAALAVAILDHVYKIGAGCIATTHYSELKGYAYNREGVMNASVEFDVETLRPTYRLLIGVPGRSNAFAISSRLGLQEDIIEEAKKQISADTNQVENMISQLEDSRKNAESELARAKELRNESESLHRELTEELDAWEEKKQALLQAAQDKAEKEAKKAQQEAEEIVEYLREMKKQNPEIKDHELIDARKRMEEAQPSFAESSKKKKPKKKKAVVDTLQPGDEVKVESLNQKGHIVEKVSEKEFTVQLGVMKMKVPAKDLLYINRPKPVETRPMATVRGRSAHVKTELDLRGERYEDAMREVDKYLDEAVLAGYHQVSIIHGKGTGALRKGVEEMMKRHPNISETRPGTQGEGGSGVTIARLK